MATPLLMLRNKQKKEDDKGRCKLTHFNFWFISLFCFISFDFHFINFFWELVKLKPAPIPGHKHRGDDVSASEFSEGKDRAAHFFCCSGAFWRSTWNQGVPAEQHGTSQQAAHLLCSCRQALHSHT